MMVADAPASQLSGEKLFNILEPLVKNDPQYASVH